MNFLLLVCSLFLWLGDASLAVAHSKPYIINGMENGVLIQPYALLAEDKKGNASLTDMLAQPRFQPISTKQLTPGYSHSAFWLRTRLSNSLSHPVTVWLETGTARLQEVTLYQRIDGHWSVDEAGTQYPFAARPLETTTPVFPVRLAAGEERELIWRIASDTSISLLPQLWLPEHFRSDEGSDSMLDGIEFGVLTIISLYSLMLFFSLQQRGFLYYALSVLSYAIYEVSISGYGFRYLWPEATFWATRIISLSATISIALFVLVFREFLNTREYAPRWDKFLLALLACLGGSLTLSQLVDYGTGAQLGTMLSLVVTISMPVLCTVLLYRGPAGSWAYGLASFSCLVGNLARVMEILGWRAPDILSAYGTQLGSIISTSLLLIAFTLQMRQVRIQKDKAMSSLLELKEQQRQQLEQQVIIRTNELNIALHEAHLANQAKSRLLAHISHDLRAPLSIIIGYARLLQQPRQDNAACLRAIEDNARHQLALIDELIDFSASELGEIVLRPRDGSWPDFIGAMANDARQLAIQHDNHFELDIAPDISPALHLDFKRLRQVLANLLSNAAKFTHNGNIRLTVNAQQQAQQCWLAFSVSDSGMGMTQDTLDRLYQPFERGDNAQETQGTGLGLVIATAILTKMGGQLTVHSTQGLGSQFSFSIPVTTAEPLAPVSPLAAPATAVASGYCILLADDHAQSRALTAHWLRSAGHEVLEATDGYAALSMLATRSVTVIVSDQQMPACDGWELLANVRQQHASLPVLLFSAMPPCRPPCLPGTLDFDAHLQKPASPEQLLSLLQPLLEPPCRVSAISLSGTAQTELNALLQEGRISDIERWAQNLWQEHPAQRELAAQISLAATNLDLEALHRLLGQPGTTPHQA